MVFHPVAEEVARALNARRAPPPPVVPTLAPEVLRRFANEIFAHAARRDIAEGLLVLAIRLDVLGFYRPRDQLLLLSGCGLSASEITDSLVRRRAREAGAHQLMDKARSTSATPMERALTKSSAGSATGVGLRSRERALQRAGKDRLGRDNPAQPAPGGPAGRPGPVPLPGARGPGRATGSRQEVTEAAGKGPTAPPTSGRRGPSGSSGRGGPAGRG